jgi:hypothetical protein
MEDDVTNDFAEFALANAIYAALVESHACEQSSRCVPFASTLLTLLDSFHICSRNAMDNASKNAKDMISTLQMQYNRGRQAAITNELVDIITGLLLVAFRICSAYTGLAQAQVLCELCVGAKQDASATCLYSMLNGRHFRMTCMKEFSISVIPAATM